MNAVDTIQVHFFVASPSQGWNIAVSDLTTGHSGTYVLNSTYGPLLPLFSAQQIGNALGWGLVDDTPNSFVWEIGHTSNFATPAGKLCNPGEVSCDSYDTAHWLGFSPIKIVSVTFGNGSAAKQWAVVSDLGGTAEVTASCASYGGRRFHLLRHGAHPDAISQAGFEMRLRAVTWPAGRRISRPGG